jgi:hypothetical protein
MTLMFVLIKLSCKKFSDLQDYKEGKVFCVHTVKACRGSRGMALLIVNLCTRWRLVVQLHVLATLPLGQDPSVH